MTVKTFVQPDRASQSDPVYFAAIDASTAVYTRLGDSFAPHAQSTLNMTVALDAGHLMNGQTLVEVATQNTALITAPSVDSRIDRIVIDNVTGTVSVVTGAAAVSPLPPAIPTGKSPVAQVRLVPTSTTITDTMITDERDFSNLGTTTGALLNVQTFTVSGTYTPTLGTKKVIVEVQGAGGSGGGVAATTATTAAAASGGGAGAYGRALITSGFGGVTVTVGAGGIPGTAGAVNGNDGGNSSFGTLVVSAGGKAGLGAPAVTPPLTRGTGGVSSLPTGANIVAAAGASAGIGMTISTVAIAGGNGGSSFFGGGGLGAGPGAGNAATSPGSGGGGAAANASNVARSGGSGADGVIIIYEYA